LRVEEGIIANSHVAHSLMQEEVLVLLRATLERLLEELQ
jgi:broad-specificity NMP kinase